MGSRDVFSFSALTIAICKARNSDVRVAFSDRADCKAATRAGSCATPICEHDGGGGERCVCEWCKRRAGRGGGRLLL